MTGDRISRDAAHFQRLYEASTDPWQFRTSAYEQAKYHRTIACLGDRRFRSGFEIGCSIGVLTRMLAERCDALLAVDIVELPLRSARFHCADQPWVQFAQACVPRDWPAQTFDLIVLSEVLYFLAPQEIAAVADLTVGAIEPQGLVLLVNWRGRTGDPCSGDEAADLFIRRSRGSLETAAQHCEPRYRLDLLRRHDGSSPARHGR